MTSPQKQLLKSLMGMMINVGMHRFIFFQITSNTLAADICQCWVWCDTSFKLSRYPAYIVLPITVTVINAFSSHRHLKCGTAKDLEANNMSELTTSCYVTIIKASHEVLNQTNVFTLGPDVMPLRKNIIGVKVNEGDKVRKSKVVSSYVFSHVRSL